MANRGSGDSREGERGIFNREEREDAKQCRENDEGPRADGTAAKGGRRKENDPRKALQDTEE